MSRWFYIGISQIINTERRCSTAISHPMVAVSKENNIPPPHGACDGHDHATGGIVPAVTSLDPSGTASTAVLSPSLPFSLNDRMAQANLLRAKWQDAVDANIATLAPVQEKLLLKKQQWPTFLSVYVALVLPLLVTVQREGFHQW
jgi:hypothetical protein